MDFLLFRFLERMTVVLIGGMAIYLGFRLFLAVPELRESDGEVKLPWNISIVMTRVGPGVFFALFGIAALSLALYRPLDRTARADARALLRKEIARLNA